MGAFITNKKKEYIISFLVIIGVTTVSFFANSFLGYKAVALFLLVSLSCLAMLFDIMPVLLAAILSALIWNFFFIPPIFTFHISSAEDLLLFLMYFVIALVNAVLTFKIRKVEKEARDKKEKEKSIALYNTLLNSLSHELRTPISTIIAAVDTLKNNETKLALSTQAELLSSINAAGFRLNRQVENLLNMSRLETGMLQLSLDWCDMNEIVFNVLQKIDANELKHKIEFIPIDNFPLFKIDAVLLEEVIYNILHNAVQYTPENSKVKIELSMYNQLCVIEISDEGKGFTANEINLLFDKFYRLPHSKAGGTGLGLSIAKGFVEAHNGKISVSNKSSGGAVFRIEIPAEISYLNCVKHE